MSLDPARVERLAAWAYAHHHPDASLAYERLPEAEKEANRDGVRAIPALVAALGYRIVADASGSGDGAGDAGAVAEAAGTPRVTALTDDEVERAAVLEHDRWMAFTRRRGYRHGPTRDDEARTHPDLVPWDDLDEPTRDKDRVRVRAIPQLLATVGLRLVTDPAADPVVGPEAGR